MNPWVNSSISTNSILSGTVSAPLKLGTGTSMPSAQDSVTSDADLTPEQQAHLATILCHELRTPLTVILGVLGLLQGGQLSPDSEDGKQWLDLAITNVDRITRLAALIEQNPNLSTLILSSWNESDWPGRPLA